MTKKSPLISAADITRHGSVFSAMLASMAEAGIAGSNETPPVKVIEAPQEQSYPDPEAAYEHIRNESEAIKAQIDATGPVLNEEDGQNREAAKSKIDELRDTAQRALEELKRVKANTGNLRGGERDEAERLVDETAHAVEAEQQKIRQEAEEASSPVGELRRLQKEYLDMKQSGMAAGLREKQEAIDILQKNIDVAQPKKEASTQEGRTAQLEQERQEAEEAMKIASVTGDTEGMKVAGKKFMATRNELSRINEGIYHAELNARVDAEDSQGPTQVTEAPSPAPEVPDFDTTFETNEQAEALRAPQAEAMRRAEQEVGLDMSRLRSAEEEIRPEEVGRQTEALPAVEAEQPPPVERTQESRDERAPAPNAAASIEDLIHGAERVGDVKDVGFFLEQGLRTEAAIEDVQSWWHGIWAKRAKDALVKRDSRIAVLEARAKQQAERSWVGTAINPFTYGWRVHWHRWRRGQIEANQSRLDDAKQQHELTRNNILDQLSVRYESNVRAYEEQARLFARESKRLDGVLASLVGEIKKLDVAWATERDAQQRIRLESQRAELFNEHARITNQKSEVEKRLVPLNDKKTQTQRIVNGIQRDSNPVGRPDTSLKEGAREKRGARAKREGSMTLDRAA